MAEGHGARLRLAPCAAQQALQMWPGGTHCPIPTEGAPSFLGPPNRPRGEQPSRACYDLFQDRNPDIFTTDINVSRRLRCTFERPEWPNLLKFELTDVPTYIRLVHFERLECLDAPGPPWTRLDRLDAPGPPGRAWTAWMRLDRLDHLDAPGPPGPPGRTWAAWKHLDAPLRAPALQLETWSAHWDRATRYRAASKLVQAVAYIRATHLERVDRLDRLDAPGPPRLESTGVRGGSERPRVTGCHWSAGRPGGTGRHCSAWRNWTTWSDWSPPECLEDPDDLEGLESIGAPRGLGRPGVTRCHCSSWRTWRTWTRSPSQRLRTRTC